MPRLTLTDWLALALSLLAAAAAGWVAVNIYEAVPHIEDDFAYTWQAAAIASGKLKVLSPPAPKSFLIPFVVDHQGWRFGKYPIGWPALLAVGVRLGMRAWVNPLLAGLGVWFTYRLGKTVANPGIGLLAAVLTLTSPFFLMNAGSLLAHPLGLVLTAAFVLGWIEAFTPPDEGSQDADRRVPRWLPTAAGGMALGMLGFTRPFTAAAVALPFALHGLFLLWRGDRAVRTRLLLFGGLALAVSLVHPLWQYAAAGDPAQNTYTLWWPYDKIGFGPGIGATESGHNLEKAVDNTQIGLNAGAYDLFGWPRVSYLLVPFGLWALRRSLKAWLAGSVFFVLVAAYMAYWVGAALFGPRYYFEGLFSLTILSAAGVAWLGGWAARGVETVRSNPKWARARRLSVTGALAALMLFNLLVYLPLRLGFMHRLFGIGGAEIAAFQESAPAALETPALVFVDSARWMHYAIYTDLQDPELTSPYIFAWSIGPDTDQAASAHFPDRRVYYYYPDEPGRFYDPPGR